MNEYIYRPLGENVEEMFIGPFGSSLKNECFVDKEEAYCMVYEQKHAIQKTMDVETRYINEQKYNELKRFNVRSGDIIVSCRGTIGETYIIPDGAPLGIMHPSIMKIRLKEGVYDKYYFNLLLRSRLKKHESEANGSGVKMAVSATELSKELLPVPTMNEQLKITDIVSKINNVIGKRKQELAELDDLIKARFVEMFGDMHLNSKGWSEAKLESMADVVSGITKGRKTKSEDLTEVPYMAVSNVKDGYIDWTTVKTIGATQQEIEQYQLLADDVLMTEGGDPDKVGRGAIIKEPLENCIHQNHIFRVRLDESVVLPEFFAEYLQHQRSKRYFLGCAKQTTGIASINMTQLRALPVLIPPLSKQEEFVLFKAQVDKSKVAIQKALDEMQILFDSLLQKYFS